MSDSKAWDLQVQPVRAGVVVPGYGTVFGLKSVSTSGQKRVLPIVPSGTEGKFYVLFGEDDVDFKIYIDNSSCMDRDVLFELNSQDDLFTRSLIVRRGQTGALKTWETDGRKFHFDSKSRPGSQQAGIGIFGKKKSRLMFDRASTSVSQIRLEKIRYSSAGFPIFVKILLTGKRVEIFVSPEDTVELLKHKISDVEGIPPDQQSLIFGGRVLEDGLSVESLDLRRDSTLYLNLRVHEGGDAPSGKEFLEKEMLEENAKRKRDEIYAEVKERGAIVFEESGGKRSSKGIFYPDDSVFVNGFTFELKMALNFDAL